MIRPLTGKIAITKIDNKDATDSGIYVPGGVENIDKATVVSIGNEVEDVSVGDTIMVDWQKALKTNILTEYSPYANIWLVDVKEVVAVFD